MTDHDQVIEKLHNALTTVETLKAASEGRPIAIYLREIQEAMDSAWDFLNGLEKNRGIP